jgi:hypothetical protein
MQAAPRLPVCRLLQRALQAGLDCVLKLLEESEGLLCSAPRHPAGNRDRLRR